MVQPVSSSSFSPIAIGVCEALSPFEQLIGVLPFAPRGLGAAIAAKPWLSRQIYHHTQKWTERLLKILENELGEEETVALIKKYIEKQPLPEGYSLDNMSNQMRLHALIQSLKGGYKGIIRFNLSKSDFEHIEREVLTLSARVEAELAKGLYCENADPQKIEITHSKYNINRFPMVTIAFTQQAINVNRATQVIFQFNNRKILKIPQLDLLSPHLVKLHLSGNRLSVVPKLSLEKLQVLDLVPS